MAERMRPTMADLADAEIARRVAEVMGLGANLVPVGEADEGHGTPCDGFGPAGECSMCTGLVEQDAAPFNPLADSDQGWADFGRVWRWADGRNVEVSMGNDGVGVCSAGRPPRLIWEKDSNPRRALCLAILAAEGQG